MSTVATDSVSKGEVGVVLRNSGSPFVQWANGNSSEAEWHTIELKQLSNDVSNPFYLFYKFIIVKVGWFTNSQSVLKCVC